MRTFNLNNLKKLITSVGHQMICTMALPQLLMLSAFYTASTITIKFVHCQIVFIWEAAVSLLNVHVFGLGIIVDIFNGNLTTGKKIELNFLIKKLKNLRVMNELIDL